MALAAPLTFAGLVAGCGGPRPPVVMHLQPLRHPDLDIRLTAATYQNRQLRLAVTIENRSTSTYMPALDVSLSCEGKYGWQKATPDEVTPKPSTLEPGTSTQLTLLWSRSIATCDIARSLKKRGMETVWYFWNLTTDPTRMAGHLVPLRLTGFDMSGEAFVWKPPRWVTQEIGRGFEEDRYVCPFKYVTTMPPGAETFSCPADRPHAIALRGQLDIAEECGKRAVGHKYMDGCRVEKLFRDGLGMSTLVGCCAKRLATVPVYD